MPGLCGYIVYFQMAELKKYVFKRNAKDPYAKSGRPRYDREQSEKSPLHYIPEIHPEDSRIEDAKKEGEMEIYEETYDDYLEMFIQFGYVVLFSSVYPMAAFWAVFNNVLEVRADAFKLCVVYQRPMARRVKDIGAWQVRFFYFLVFHCAKCVFAENL